MEKAETCTSPSSSSLTSTLKRLESDPTSDLWILQLRNAVEGLSKADTKMGGGENGSSSKSTAIAAASTMAELNAGQADWPASATDPPISDNEKTPAARAMKNTFFLTTSLAELRKMLA
jgi:hypothetical protein